MICYWICLSKTRIRTDVSAVVSSSSNGQWHPSLPLPCISYTVSILFNQRRAWHIQLREAITVTKWTHVLYCCLFSARSWVGRGRVTAWICGVWVEGYSVQMLDYINGKLEAGCSQFSVSRWWVGRQSGRSSLSQFKNFWKSSYDDGIRFSRVPGPGAVRLRGERRQRRLLQEVQRRAEGWRGERPRRLRGQIQAGRHADDALRRDPRGRNQVRLKVGRTNFSPTSHVLNSISYNHVS